MVDIPSREPLSFRAGDTVQWLKSLSAYPASAGNVLKYYLVKSGKQIVLTAEPSGDSHMVKITSVDSGAFEAGRYFYQVRIENGGEVFTVGEGIIEVKASLATSTDGLEWRAHCERALENIEAILLGKATADNYSYSIAGRSMSKYSWTELREMRGYYRNELRAFNRKYGLARPSKIGVQFS
jgi:hypothetical protein